MPAKYPGLKLDGKFNFHHQDSSCVGSSGASCPTGIRSGTTHNHWVCGELRGLSAHWKSSNTRSFGRLIPRERGGGLFMRGLARKTFPVMEDYPRVVVKIRYWENDNPHWGERRGSLSAVFWLLVYLWFRLFLLSWRITPGYTQYKNYVTGNRRRENHIQRKEKEFYLRFWLLVDLCLVIFAVMEDYPSIQLVGKLRYWEKEEDKPHWVSRRGIYLRYWLLVNFYLVSLGYFCWHEGLLPEFN